MQRGSKGLWPSQAYEILSPKAPPGFWGFAECHWGGEERDTYLHPEDLSPTLVELKLQLGDLRPAQRTPN